jgi:tetratricopeptide (TPR) repeat protein
MTRITGIMLLLLLCAGVARADKAAAEAAYREAVKRYDLNEFQTALDSFKRAYIEYEEPTLLFNIAQCHRQLGQRSKAIQFYRSYLRRLPEAGNRDEVKRIMDNLEAAIAQERASTTAPPMGVIDAPGAGATTTTAPSVAPQPSLLVARPAASPPRPRRRWLWVVAGGGAALVITAVAVGVAFGVSAPRASATFGSTVGN